MNKKNDICKGCANRYPYRDGRRIKYACLYQETRKYGSQSCNDYKAKKEA